MQRVLDAWRKLLGRFGPTKIIAYSLLTLSVILTIVGLYAFFATPTTRQHALRITAGSRLETRVKLAEYLQSEAADVRIDIALHAADGSIDALDKVNRGELDLALVQGGLYVPEHDNIRQVAAILVEPVHFLVKQEWHSNDLKALDNLKGKTINLGPVKSGSHTLGKRLLEFTGLKPIEKGADQDKGYHLRTMRYKDVHAVLDAMEKAHDVKRRALRIKLPDAFVFVATMPSRVAKRLVRVGGYRLVPIPFGEAFAMINVEEETHDSDRIHEIHLTTTSIPKFTYRVKPAVPAEATPTVGAYLLLVAHKDVPNDAIARLLPLIYDGPVEHLYHASKWQSLPPEYPLHPGTVSFRNRNKPFVRAEFFDWIQRAFSILGPLLGALLALYGYFRWRQVLRFTAYFEEIVRLELIGTGKLKEKNVPEDAKERLRYVQENLDKVEREAVADFCGNYLRGESVVEALLALVTSVRTRLEQEQASKGA